MERTPVRSHNPSQMCALKVSVAAPVVPGLPFGARHRTTTSRYKKFLLLQRGQCPHTRGLSNPKRITAYDASVSTHSRRKPQVFTRTTWWLREQARSPTLAAPRTVIANHYTSGVACGCTTATEAFSRLDSTPPRAQPTWMNALGRWAEL